MERKSTIAANKLIGVWRLDSFRIKKADNSILKPFGENPDGLLIYDASGYMSVNLMSKKVPPFAGQSPFSATNAEKLKAFEGFLGYSGRYRISGHQIIHLPQVGSFPNWIGKELIRDVEITDNQLKLTTTRSGPNGQIAELIWKRAETG